VIEEVYIRVLVGNFRGNDHLGYLGMDGGIILKWIIKKIGRHVYWIGLGQDIDRWQALMNALGP
jgi:hypothetical protein